MVASLGKMHCFQGFTTNSMDALSVLQSKVHNLEITVDKIAQDFSMSRNCVNGARAKLLQDSVGSSPRPSSCSSRRSVDTSYMQSSSLSARRRETSGDTAPPTSRSNAPVMWTSDASKNAASKNSIAEGRSEKGSGRRHQRCEDSVQAGKPGGGVTSPARAPQGRSDARSAVWKRIKEMMRAGDLEAAYAEAIGSGDDLVLIELMDRTGAVLEALSQETAGGVLGALSVYMTADQRYLELAIPWLQQASRSIGMLFSFLSLPRSRLGRVIILPRWLLTLCFSSLMGPPNGWMDGWCTSCYAGGGAERGKRSGGRPSVEEGEERAPGGPAGRRGHGFRGASGHRADFVEAAARMVRGPSAQVGRQRRVNTSCPLAAGWDGLLSLFMILKRTGGV